MSSLRNKVIKLAHDNPKLRKHLLPILAKTGAEKAKTEEGAKKLFEKYMDGLTPEGRKTTKKTPKDFYEKPESKGKDKDDEKGKGVDMSSPAGEGDDKGDWSDEQFSEFNNRVQDFLKTKKAPKSMESLIGLKDGDDTIDKEYLDGMWDQLAGSGGKPWDDVPWSAGASPEEMGKAWADNFEGSYKDHLESFGKNKDKVQKALGKAMGDILSGKAK